MATARGWTDPAATSGQRQRTIFQAEFDWTVDDFLNWAESQDDGSSKYSPMHTFKVGPEVNKKFSFSLTLFPREGARSDNVGIHLNNSNSRPVKVTASIKSANSSLTFTRLLKRGCSFGSRIWLNRSSLAKKSNFLPDGKLHIRCKIWIILDDVKIGKNDSEGGHPVLSKLLFDEILSDFKISSCERVFPCHKSILAAKSDVFKAMFEPNRWAEAKKISIGIDDFDPDTVQDMLRFIYLGETQTCNAELLLLADKYNVEGMVDHCEFRLAETVGIDNVIDVICAAFDASGAKLLQSLCVDIVCSNFKKLNTVPNWEKISKTKSCGTIWKEIFDAKDD